MSRRPSMKKTTCAESYVSEFPVGYKKSTSSGHVYFDDENSVHDEHLNQELDRPFPRPELFVVLTWE